MKTTYIHIGTNKTGSSAIQAFLTINNKLLKEKGYAFPHPPNIDNNQPYQTSAGNGLYLKEAMLKKNYTLLKELIFKNKNKNIIYSSEGLRFLLSIMDKDFYSFFKDNNCKVICYIRRQDDYINSYINQRIKNHNLADLEIENFIIDTQLFFNNLNNKKYLKDILILRPYEKEQFYGGNIFSDFLNILGLELTDEYQYPDKIVNPSFSPDILEFRRLMNYYDNDILKDKLPINKKLADYTVKNGYGESFSNTYIISKEDRKYILNSFEVINSQIAKYYLERENGKLFINDINLDNDNYADLSKVTNKEIINILKYLKGDEINKNFQKQIAHLVLNNNSELELNERQKGNILYSINDLKITRLNMIDNLKKDDKIKFKSKGNDPFFIIDNNFSKNSLTLSIKLNVPDDTTFQVFYKTQNINFGPNNVISKKLQKGINHFLLHINSDEVIEKIRIDPGNISGEYTIEELNIFI